MSCTFPKFAPELNCTVDYYTALHPGPFYFLIITVTVFCLLSIPGIVNIVRYASSANKTALRNEIFKIHAFNVVSNAFVIPHAVLGFSLKSLESRAIYLTLHWMSHLATYIAFHANLTNNIVLAKLSLPKETTLHEILALNRKNTMTIFYGTEMLILPLELLIPQVNVQHLWVMHIPFQALILPPAMKKIDLTLELIKRKADIKQINFEEQLKKVDTYKKKAIGSFFALFFILTLLPLTLIYPIVFVILQVLGHFLLVFGAIRSVLAAEKALKIIQGSKTAPN